MKVQDTHSLKYLWSHSKVKFCLMLWMMVTSYVFVPLIFFIASFQHYSSGRGEQAALELSLAFLVCLFNLFFFVARNQMLSFHHRLNKLESEKYYPGTYKERCLKALLVDTQLSCPDKRFVEWVLINLDHLTEHENKRIKTLIDEHVWRCNS